MQIIWVVWLSEKYGERMLFASLSNIWMLPFLIGLVCISPTASPWVRYILLTGVNGIPYTHAILVGLISRNSNSVATRAVANPLYNMTYQFGSIAAVNIYRDKDKPFCKDRYGHLPLFTDCARLSWKSYPCRYLLSKHTFVLAWENVLYLAK